MRKTLSILLGTTTLLFGAPTVTKTTFIEYSPGITEKFMKIDKHGNSIYESKVQIETKNFEVKNFWKKFSLDGEGQDSMKFDSISKTGTIQISVEAISLCTLYPDLDEKSCSGQKPFLINASAVTRANLNADKNITLTFQKDFDGSSSLYDGTNDFSFYPLDIDRDGDYTQTVTVEKNCHSLLCKLTSMFDGFFQTGFFSKLFGINVSSGSSVNVDDVRKRYIANISAGVDQNHLMETNNTIEKQYQNRNTHDPISFIDYTQTSASEGSCNIGFFKFSSENTICNLMSGMPFISFFAKKTPEQKYTVDTIQVDTENAIITFAGAYANITVTDYETTVNKTLTKDSSTMFPPFEMMKNMMCMMMPFINCDDTTIEEEKGRIKDSVYTFAEENATTLTMAVTKNGTKVNAFQTFKLLGIHSIVGDGNVTTGGSCSIKTEARSCGWGCSKWKDKGTVSYLEDFPKDVWIDKSAVIGSTYYKNGYDFCKSGQSADNGGIVLAATKRYTSSSILPGSSEMKNSGRVLSLDLKLVDLNTTSKAAKLRYKLMSTN